MAAPDTLLNHPEKKLLADGEKDMPNLMELSTRWLLIGARVLLALVFLLNGFGVINQAIPAKEMIERGAPPAIVPFAMFAGRFLEIVAGFGLALGIFPRWSALLLFAFLVPATFVSHSFWLAAGTPQFQGQLIVAGRTKN